MNRHFKRSIAPFAIHCLGLPEEIAAKILHRNAVRLLGLQDNTAR
jgi:predicted TIM-barrel fold metal-dependent hydrolase